MDANQREFEFLAASVERAVRVQRDVPARYLDARSRRGAKLARHLLALYDAIDGHVGKRRAQFSSAADDAAREGAKTEMRELIVGARRLQTNMAWVDAARHPPLDLGTTYFVDSIARQLVAHDADLVVVASHELSYATSSNPFSQAITALGGTAPPGETTIVVFVPRREQHSGLLHPLIVHELGHAVVAEHGLVKAMLGDAGRRKRLISRLQKLSQNTAAAQAVPVAEASAAIVVRLAAWLEELLCDCIATEVLGPTYLYSFLAEVTAGNVDAVGPKHPPPRQRVRLLLKQLDAGGWGPVMASAGAGLDQWTRDLAAERVTYSGVEEFLVWSAETVARDVRARVARQLKGHTFRPQDDELNEIDTLLKSGIPPAQSAGGVALARPAIILGCWLYALRDAGGDVAALAVAPDAQELARLLPKGLEMSAIVGAWN